jgi:hypothetical protein
MEILNRFRIIPGCRRGLARLPAWRNSFEGFLGEIKDRPRAHKFHFFASPVGDVLQSVA